MKLSLLSLAMLSLSSAAQGADFTGTYLSPTTTWIFAEKAECDEAKGTFEAIEKGEDRGICYYAIDNTVEVKKQGADYLLEISTFGGNTHACTYEGKASLVNDQLISVTKVDDLDEGRNTCTITLSHTGDKTISVSEEGDACRWFCGARGPGFTLEKATRK